MIVFVTLWAFVLRGSEPAPEALGATLLGMFWGVCY